MVVVLHISGFAQLRVSRVIVICSVITCTCCSIHAQRLIIIFSIHFCQIKLLIRCINVSSLWFRISFRFSVSKPTTTRTRDNVGKENANNNSTHQRHNNMPYYNSSTTVTIYLGTCSLSWKYISRIDEFENWVKECQLGAKELKRCQWHCSCTCYFKLVNNNAKVWQGNNRPLNEIDFQILTL